MYFAFWTVVAVIFLIFVFRREVGGSDKSDTSRSGFSMQNVYREKMQRIAEEHADWTAEVLSLTIMDARKAGIMHGVSPGDPVELKYSTRYGVGVYVDNKRVGTLTCPDDSRVPELLKEYEYVKAYLGGRDNEYILSDVDFCSIIVFYRIPGVPPTQININ